GLRAFHERRIPPVSLLPSPSFRSCRLAVLPSCHLLLDCLTLRLATPLTARQVLRRLCLIPIQQVGICLKVRRRPAAPPVLPEIGLINAAPRAECGYGGRDSQKMRRSWQRFARVVTGLALAVLVVPAPLVSAQTPVAESADLAGLKSYMVDHA